MTDDNTKDDKKPISLSDQELKKHLEAGGREGAEKDFDEILKRASEPRE